VRICDVYGRGRPVFSFEFFPPKTDAGAENLMRTCSDLKKALEPDFVSVTYGAGGSTRDRTHSLVTRIQAELGLTAMAHQTCVAATRDDVRENLRLLAASGIENVLALRGDPPKGEQSFEVLEDGLAHATDLIELAAGDFDLCIGAACYPEDHLESTSSEDDMQWTKLKVELGASFMISQLFFDNRFYWDFVGRAREAGIEVPIVPGIMPVTNVAQVSRMAGMSGTAVPAWLVERVGKASDDVEESARIGIDIATELCAGLLDAGAPGLHFYTLNRSSATRDIYANLGLPIPA
jgi:methylenetetrahydrofolate reductase (NADPH)